ncbi:MAG: helix-turn-helix transcriptional regulator [Candidatus Omnitrophica bacterium]|nr:helix-turn-helix transcriptional regulator [Candidatus Omnitrophota bacterium]
MKNDWLWDRKISISEAKRILKDPKHNNFIFLASILLSRKNNPKEIFKDSLDPLLFCKYWAIIKKRMRKDKWNDARIVFWQAIYEKLMEKYRERGISFKKDTLKIKNALSEETGKQIRNIRQEQDLSQKELAGKLGVSQQLISRIEKGKENISLSTLSNVSRALGRKIEINFVS